MPDLILQTATLAATAFLASIVDAIAGGGGLIVVPALLLAGFSPVEALGTNKLQGLMGTASASVHYARAGLVSPRAQLAPALLAGLGGVLGAALATVAPGGWPRAALPLMLIAIAIYFAVKRGLDDTDRAARIGPGAFAVTVAPAIGFYDGLFGPGAGSFYMLAYVTLAGLGVLKATGHTKLLNFASNVGSFALFAVAGAVSWRTGLAMGLAAILGARVGSLLAQRIGARLVRPLIVVVSLLLAAKLILDPAGPWRGMLGLS